MTDKVLDYIPEKTIIIVGYPRSGNTWLTRLIAESLNSPASRFRSALPLSVEGQDRPGNWLVTQLHLKPEHAGKNEEAIIDSWRFNLDSWKGESIIYIVRDPRDVAISAKHYWEIPTIRQALMDMHDGTGPLREVGEWNTFNKLWMRLKAEEYSEFERNIPNFSISYETLYSLTNYIIQLILEGIPGAEKDHDQITSAVKNQQFATKKHEIEFEYTNGTQNARPYGKTIQLKTMRNGKPLQWVDEMSDEDNQFALDCFGEVMQWMGYPTN